MNVSIRPLLFFCLLIQLLAISPLFASSQPICSFITMVTSDEYSYEVMSQPMGSCEKQNLKISVLKQAIPFTGFSATTQDVVEKAWAEDLDDDGVYELLILSHTFTEPARKNLDIFSVEGSLLKRLSLPVADQSTGYRGGDSFSVANGKIIRFYPKYLQGDADGKPTGGQARIQFQYRNRQLFPVADRETKGDVAAATSMVKGKSKGVQQVKLKSIEVKQDYIEIKADGAIESYKTSRVPDPWRLVIDIAGASSDLPVKELPINSLGISMARIGADRGRVRIVFDAADSYLPTETVTQAENALRVGFYKPRTK